VSELVNGSLDTLAASAKAAGRFAFDTEFMGEGRYRTLLCLIQLAVPDANPANPERIELIDPLEQDLDGAPLAAMLADPAIQTVVHAGRQDVALVRRRFATDVRDVFDTQIAAGFAGLGAQSSYDTLLAEILDVRLAKSASFTRWDTRPLSPEQLSYAREDVVHLLALAAELEGRLTALGRLEWAREECRFLGVRAPAADSGPEPLLADDRPRACGVARAYGRKCGPTGAEHPRRRAARGDRQAQALLHPAT
jgi:ribonuclease D